MWPKRQFIYKPICLLFIFPKLADVIYNKNNNSNKKHTEKRFESPSLVQKFARNKQTGKL